MSNTLQQQQRKLEGVFSEEVREMYLPSRKANGKFWYAEEYRVVGA